MTRYSRVSSAGHSLCVKSAWRTGDGARSVARRTQTREIKTSLAKEKRTTTSRAGATVRAPEERQERIEQKEQTK